VVVPELVVPSPKSHLKVYGGVAPVTVAAKEAGTPGDGTDGEFVNLVVKDN